jgi:predicted dehydrogenase
MKKNQKIKKLSGLIIGCGSIGERHLFNLQKLGLKDIIIYDKDLTQLKKIENKYSVKSFSNIDKAFSAKPDFSIICTHPISHITFGEKSLKNNVHVFMEKPLSHELKNVKQFLNKSESKKIKISVGYNFRYNLGLNYIKNFFAKNSITPSFISSTVGNHIKNWRPNSNYKNHYILNKGGGIILDASHEFDFVRWLLDDKVVSVYCQSIKTSKLSKKTESLASITLKFKKGTIANFTLDYIRPFYDRKCQFLTENEIIDWNFSIEPKISKNYNVSSKSLVSYQNHKKKSFSKNFISPVNQMYKEEINDFLISLVTNENVKINGWDAYETLRIADAALRSSKINKPIILK